MEISADVCYRALSSHDARFDGRFFTAVTSTGVYCRPVCPARVPLRRNCEFYPSAAAAEAAGFRPCLRCRPETSPGTPAWLGTSATVSRALRLIEAGALADGDIDTLAGRLGVGARQLRRLFETHLGAPPIAIEQTRRVHLAKKLLDETNLPITDIAFSAGFASVRRFNAAIHKVYGRSPRELRRGRRENGENGSLRLRLAYRPPFDWPRLLAFFHARATPGVELVDGDEYRRSVAIGAFRGVIAVRPAAGNALELFVPRAAAPVVAALVERVRGVFDLGADPHEIGRQLGRDPLLRPLVRRRPGLRVPGGWDRFEIAVRAVLGQQVTVRGATTLAGRLARAYGAPLATAEGGIDRLFPDPASLATADLSTIGLPRARAATITAVAAAALAGAPAFAAEPSLAEAVEELCGLPGVGEWTAHYFAMRALREPDAFPHGDLGLRRALAANGRPAAPTAVAERAEAWRPWRAYAALHLWADDAERSGRSERKGTR